MKNQSNWNFTRENNLFAFLRHTFFWFIQIISRSGSILNYFESFLILNNSTQKSRTYSFLYVALKIPFSSQIFMHINFYMHHVKTCMRQLTKTCKTYMQVRLGHVIFDHSVIVHQKRLNRQIMCFIMFTVFTEVKGYCHCLSISGWFIKA